MTRSRRAMPGDWDRFIVPAVFVSMILIFYTLDSRYLSSANVLNIMNQVSILMVVTVAASLVIFTGGFDLSAGSVVALTGVAASLTVEITDSVALGLLAGVIAGAFVGAINGFFVGYLGVSPLIVTLGTLNMARGLALILAGGSAIYNFPAWFTDLGTSRVLRASIAVRHCARRLPDLCVPRCDLRLSASACMRPAGICGPRACLASMSHSFASALSPSPARSRRSPV